jgi:L-seryl-tRNA(Ser) seleniumtransferase
MSDLAARLRALPSVDALLSEPATAPLIERFGRQAVVGALRATLTDTRASLRSDASAAVDPAALLNAAAARLQRAFNPTLRSVINATGIIIHTNLGRAPLSPAAQRAVLEVAADYSTLEYDPETGRRGSRLIHADAVLREVTGAEAALVVNNNAAALVLILSALARDRDVIISRGQLVEIGGGFRVPDVMAQSGAHLVEVGTTNRTRLADFEQAVSERSAMIMRAHASNFRQIGFVEQPPPASLAALAHAHGILAVDDLGSGALLDTVMFGLEHEPTVQESLAAGFDLVAFSGDKLLGGPQAGIIVGKRALIDILRRHPLARALRMDKLGLAALTATLDHYRRGEAVEQIPVWRMIAKSLDDVRLTAARWAQRTGGEVISGTSAVGGGSLPGETLPTALLALSVSHPDDFTARLRAHNPPVIARIQDDRVLFDPRTVFEEQEMLLLGAIHSVQNRV